MSSINSLRSYFRESPSFSKRIRSYAKFAPVHVMKANGIVETFLNSGPERSEWPVLMTRLLGLREKFPLYPLNISLGGIWRRSLCF
jgi:hypothetical protein